MKDFLRILLFRKNGKPAWLAIIGYILFILWLISKFIN